MRPELIVPRQTDGTATPHSPAQLAEGTPVRLIRRPHVGRLGTIAALPEEPAVIPSGARVRVLSIRLDDGDRVTVPRSNVEIIDRGAIE